MNKVKVKLTGHHEAQTDGHTILTHYSANNESNNEFGTLTVKVWAVTFGTARRGQSGTAARSGPSSPRCTKCNSPPINGQGQCTNHRIAVCCCAVLICQLKG